MSSTAVWGIAFVVVGLAAMFLMFHLWGFPYDKATRTSEAPRWAMYLHRVLGYLFAAIYIFMMWKMVPRLWEYQVEFPARTTIHIVLGFGIGFLLLIKIAILRFFRHFEEWMPFLGVSIMFGTVILVGLSLPFMLQERALAASAPGGHFLSEASRARVAQLLPSAELPPSAPIAELSSAKSLQSGRDVLLDNCVKCHDLKTILDRPRAPAGWWSIVERMAEKPALFAPLTDREMYDVTAYLIAITPDLQRASKQQRQEKLARETAVSEALDAVAPTDTPVAPPPVDPAATPAATPTPPAAPTPAPARTAVVDLRKAKVVYERVCGECHDLSDVDAAPPKTSAESREMIERMIEENEAVMTAEQIKLVAAYLDAKFVTKTAK